MNNPIFTFSLDSIVECWFDYCFLKNCTFHKSTSECWVKCGRALKFKPKQKIVSKSTHEWPRVTTNDHETRKTKSDHEWEFTKIQLFCYNAIINTSLYQIIKNRTWNLVYFLQGQGSDKVGPGVGNSINPLIIMMVIIIIIIIIIIMIIIIILISTLFKDGAH